MSDPTAPMQLEDLDLVANPVRLRGNQVKKLRALISKKIGSNVTQDKLAKLIDVSQPVIVRMEKKGEDDISGPESILFRQIAQKAGVDISGDEAD